MTAKEKRLRKELTKACVALVKATYKTQEGFERSISLMQNEIAIAVGSLAAFGIPKEDGEEAMARLAEIGLTAFRQQFDKTAYMLRQGNKLQ